MYYIPVEQLQFKVNWIENVFYVASVSISAESTIDYIKQISNGRRECNKTKLSKLI